MGHKMTQEEITNGWIDNAIAYFAKLAEDKESNFYVGCETDTTPGVHSDSRPLSQ